MSDFDNCESSQYSLYKTKSMNPLRAPDPHHNLMTVKETASYLRMPTPTVYYLAQRGRIPSIKIGGRWRIPRDRINSEFLEAEKVVHPQMNVSMGNHDLVASIVQQVVQALSGKAQQG